MAGKLPGIVTNRGRERVVDAGQLHGDDLFTGDEMGIYSAYTRTEGGRDFALHLLVFQASLW